MSSRAFMATAATALAVLWGGGAEVRAQEPGPARDSGQLDWLVGDWDVTWSYATAGGRAAREGEMRTRWVFDGWILQDEILERRADGSVIRTMIQRALDPSSGRWHVHSWELPADEHPYLLDGEFGEDGIMRGAGGPADSDLQVRYALEPTEGGFLLSMDLSRDGGETWAEGVQVIEGRRR